MFSPTTTATALNDALATLSGIGGLFGPVIVLAAIAVIVTAALSPARRFLPAALGALTGALALG